MRLRLIKTKTGLKLLCPNGSTLAADESVLASLLTGFKHPNEFKGSDEYWSNSISKMEDVRGETLAYVDKKGSLVIVNENTFASIILQEKYISVSEYADLHKKSRAIIKKLCADGRLMGAYKTSSGWLIPKNTPYPKDGRVSNGGHHTTQKEQ